MKKQQRTLFCIGYGYCARFLAERLRPMGYAVLATTRSEDKAGELRSSGITPILLNGAQIPEIPAGADWLVSAPPDAAGCPGFRQFRGQASSARWIGYLSTTGVYGDLNGGWAFEWSPLSPSNARAENRVSAEAQWQGSGGPAHIFRLPGIYGPERSALDRLEAGQAQRIIKPGQVFSRIHVEDIATCLEASLHAPNPGRAYHACDDEPSPPQDVIEYAARLMNVPVPEDIPFEAADLSPMARSFYADCKRVSNARTKSELGWKPNYPTYREGLSAIYEAQKKRA